MVTQRPTGTDRALNAALSGPAFMSRVGGSALHSATRHVERWAPEATAGRNRPMASLGFVDRLVAPWLQTAQRSASMRMFSQYSTDGNPAFAAHDGKPVSWVFPRPWYQDELDWMAASRMQGQRQTSDSVFTTRGTYVAPSAMPTIAPAMPPSQRVMPEALFEYVAPSLSVAAGTITAGRSPTQPVFDASGGARTPAAPIAASFANPAPQQAAAYSPLVPLAAVQAAELMARAVMPGFTSHVSSVGTATLPTAAGSLNQVFASLMERAAIPTEMPSTRVAERAPTLETPPSPRAPQGPEQMAAQHQASQFAEQRARVAEVARIAQISEAQRSAQAPSEVTTSVAQTERALLARVASQAAPSTVAAAPETPVASIAPVAPVAPVDAEQARIEERIQQRLVERRQAEQVATHRLHEQARAQAAEHARASLPTTIAPPTPIAPPRPVAPPPSADVLAAISALPPALAQQLAGATSARAAISAIAELTESLRTVELMAHGTATGTAFEATRGPRLLMPAGLGGLVSTLAPSSGAMPTPSLAGRPQVFGAASVAPSAPSVRPMVSAMGSMGSTATPSFSYVAPRDTTAPTSALAATAGQAPAALGHVAWADRWLARFAGASEQSLATFSAGTRGGSASRLALAEAAPSEVFIAPMVDTERQSPRVIFDASGHPMTAAPQPRRAAPASSLAPTLSPPARASVVDDTAAASDDELASVAFAVAQQRVAKIAPPTPVVAEPHFERMGAADVLAHHAPSAPDAGFSAQLGSSPFAPALRHVLPIATSPSFDVRALFGAGLSSTFLAGLIASDAHVIQTAAGLPTVGAMEFVPRIGAFAEAAAASTDGGEPGRTAIDWDSTYVSPEALEGPRTGAFGDPSTFGDPGAFGDPRDALASSAAMPASAIPADAAAPGLAPAQLAQIESARAAVAQLQTLRTALLAWDIDVDASGAPTSAPTLAAPAALSSSTSGAPARQMLEAMSLPLLGGLGDYTSDEDRTTAVEGASWMAPGMLANRAQTWSVAQERSSADLSFDFVPPELILAARVYGLGPAEAAQAARLAVAGPGQLSAMAGTVDRTFVQALAIEAERRGTMPGYAGSSSTGYAAAQAPASTPSLAGGFTPSASDALDAPMASPLSGSAPMMTPLAAAPLAASAFGVERRTPRGATLWPAGTVAALGLNAAAPDGESSMSVAALELLAAQSVAELGTFVALGDHAPMVSTRGATFDASSDATNLDDVAVTGGQARLATAQQVIDGRRPATPDTAPNADGPGAELPEADVVSQARGMVDVNRRIRFDALYVALGQTGPGRSLSPAARAARALALAGRADDGVSLSARERAAAAWDVLPVVFAEDYDREDAAEEAALIGGAPLRGLERRAALRGWEGTLVAGDLTRSSSSSSGRSDADFAVDGRPGLSSLSARAGEALGSYVTQQAIPSGSSFSSSSSYAGNEGAIRRAPTAAQEMVQTGRPSGRSGGGEAEIPAWFEAAARRMFAEKGSTGGAEGISLAELTLVNNAPSGAIAADSVSAGKANTAVADHGPHEKDEDSGLDLESIAQDVYEKFEQLKKQVRMASGDFT